MSEMTKEQLEERNEKIKQQTEQYYLDENETRREEGLTPSGRFKLLRRYYSTKKGCWNYSRGTVYDLEGNEICDVKRNYSTFHHSFINKNNHEWLITGRSYMSQTIVNLDTGEIFEPSGDQYNGHGFCWAAETLFPDEQTLLVEGCIWAAPYEYRFYDFSDPSKGWPELEIINEEGKPDYLCIDQGDHSMEPIFNEDGSITVFETSDFYIPLGKYENDIELEELKEIPSGEMDKDENWRTDIDKKITLQRQGDKMIITSTWISPVELDRIKRRKEANKRYKEWEKEFKSSDPLYLEYLKQLKNPNLSPEKYEGRGITYPGWAPDFKEKETRWCRRLVNRDDNQPYTIDLAWAVKTGPIKLTIFKDGNSHDEKFFGHSAENMRKAFLYVHNLIEGAD